MPPVELQPAAQAVWDRLAPDLIAKRVLSAWDVDSFSVYCRSLALLHRAMAEVESEGAATERRYKGLVPSPAFRVMVAMQKTVTALGSKFGPSPADRATLRIDDSGPKSGDESYIS